MAMKDDQILDQVVMSTANQHGPKIAAEAINQAWAKAHGDRGAFIKELYDWRVTQFNKLTEKEREGAIKSLRQEEQIVHNELTYGTSARHARLYVHNQNMITNAEIQSRAAQLKIQEQELQALQDSTEKEFYTLAFDGKLSREMVEAQRDILSPSDYDKFLKMTQGKTSLPDKSDPEAVIALQHMATSGDADLQNYADDFLRTGQLTISDYRTVLNEGQQFRDPVFKQVMTDIKMLTGFSELNPTPGARESFLNARNDYLAWRDSEAGKNASQKEHLEMGQAIANRYRIVSTENSLLTLPAPMFLIGSRTKPDIGATVAKTQAEYAAGRLSEAQYHEEMVRIDKLVTVIQQQEQERTRTNMGRNNR
jgi:hypothetical protein